MTPPIHTTAATTWIQRITSRTLTAAARSGWQPRARLDVAREQADQGVVARGERPHDLGDARHHLHACAIAEGASQLLQVGVVEGLEPARDGGVVEAGAAQQVPYDTGVGLAAEVVDVDAA